MPGAMNILHIIDNFDIGGAQTRLINDLKFMNKDKFSNVACSLSGDDRLAPEIASLGVKFYSLSGLRAPTRFLKLIHIIKENSINIIHAQLFFADLYGRVAGKFMNLPIVSTVQSSAYEPDNKFLYSAKRKLADSFTGRLCNKRFIAVSEFVKKSISKNLKISLHKIDVIPNYVDIDSLAQIAPEQAEFIKKQLKIKPQDIILLAVGRLNPAKGIQYLLKALSSIALRNKSIKLFIVGDGFYRNYLENLARECGLINNVVFLGERNDVKLLLHIAHFFVFPTLSEGLPLCLLEAMATGLPCLASDIGPIREIIKHGINGLLFKSGNCEDLEETLNLALSDYKKATSLGQSAQRTVRDKFSPPENITLLENLYLDLR